jgi:hypothetical protein
MLRIFKEVPRPDRAYVHHSHFHESYLFCSSLDVVVATLVPLPESGYYEVIWNDNRGDSHRLKPVP